MLPASPVLLVLPARAASRSRVKSCWPAAWSGNVQADRCA
jgi:hypothetical protein